MTNWTPINKGDRRPEGRVLVTFDAATRAEKNLYRAIYGSEQQPDWRVGVAYWSPRLRRWMGENNSVQNVTAWGPLPQPYQQRDENDAQNAG